MPHWEELLQSVSDFIFSKHYGYRSRDLRGVKRSEKLWKIKNYPLPGRPFTHHWVKSKTICHFLRNFDAFLNGFWFYSILAGWSTWQWVFLNFSQNFWSFDTLETPGSVSAVFAENEIWNRLKHFLPVWIGGVEFCTLSSWIRKMLWILSFASRWLWNYFLHLQFVLSYNEKKGSNHLLFWCMTFLKIRGMTYSEYFKQYMCLGQHFVLISVCAKIHPFIPESLIYFSTQTSQLRIGGDYDWPLSILQDYHGPDQAAQLSFMNHVGIFLEHIVHEQVFSVLPGFVVKYQLDTAIL